MFANGCHLCQTRSCKLPKFPKQSGKKIIRAGSNPSFLRPIYLLAASSPLDCLSSSDPLWTSSTNGQTERTLMDFVKATRPPYLLAMASNLIAMPSNLIALASPRPSCRVSVLATSSPRNMSDGSLMIAPFARAIVPCTSIAEFCWNPPPLCQVQPFLVRNGFLSSPESSTTERLASEILRNWSASLGHKWQRTLAI